MSAALFLDREESVPGQLGQLLRRFKRDGEDFDAAWERSLELLTWPESRREEAEWRKQLEVTREGWRASYEDWPPEPHETAARTLMEAFDRLALVS